MGKVAECGGTFFAPGGENVYAYLARDKSQNAGHMLCGPTAFCPQGRKSGGHTQAAMGRPRRAEQQPYACNCAMAMG